MTQGAVARPRRSPLLHLGALPAVDDDAGEPATTLFAGEVRRYLDDPERRVRAYERALAACVADADLHRRRMAILFNDTRKRQDTQYDRVIGRLNERFDAAPPDAQATIRRRMERALDASFARDERREAAAAALGTVGGNDRVMAGQVLEADAARLMAERPDWVRHLRADDYTRYTANRVLEAAGAAAAAAMFIDEMLAEATRATSWSEPGFEPRVLAAVGRGDPRTLPALLELARGEGWAAGFALSTLGELGVDAAAVATGELCRKLADSDNPAHRVGSLSLVPALPDRGEATDRLLRMTRGDRYEVGEAILATVKLAPLDAGRVVPRLVELFDEFEEFDPDYQYEGRHERVCRALAAYGPLAAPAVPRVMQYLRDALADPEAEPPRDAYELLAAVGTAAAAALPVLWQLRRRGDEPDDEPEPLDPELIPLDRALLSLDPDAAATPAEL